MLEMEPAPTNRAYINHLRSTATLGSVGDAAAALLPCPRDLPRDRPTSVLNRAPHLQVVGLRLPEGLVGRKHRGLAPSTGSAAADTEKRSEDAMQGAFLTSSRYEYTFWEMAYQRETWPL